MSRKRLRDKVPQEGCSVSVASSSNIPCGRPGSYAGPIDRSLSCYRLAPSLSVSVYLPFSLSVCRFPFLTVCFCFRLQLPTHSECAELFANMRIAFRILFQTVCCGMCVWYSILQCPISAPSVPHQCPNSAPTQCPAEFYFVNSQKKMSNASRGRVQGKGQRFV